jgi:RNA polymerase sigma-70 factor (ECF subfamily)
MMQDGQIVDYILRKEEIGIDNLYQKYSATLYGMISRRVRNEDLAAELLQETMLKAWNKISTYDQEKGKLFTWLSTIARNTTIDKLRLKKHQNQNLTDSIDSQHNLADSTQSTSGLDAHNLLASLDSKYEVVLRMSYIEGYSQSEISKELRIPLGTVKTRIRKGITQIRGSLRNEKNLFIGIFLSLALIALVWNLV